MKNGVAVTAVWSERNLERGKFVKFSKTYFLNSELRKHLEFSPCDVTGEYVAFL